MNAEALNLTSPNLSLKHAEMYGWGKQHGLRKFECLLPLPAFLTSADHRVVAWLTCKCLMPAVCK